ncbi:hypothetical protein [Allosalinactinospora lopnorensis]|nr:hypothetical protein [Allosalinactinospora lopnorensis]
MSNDRSHTLSVLCAGLLWVLVVGALGYGVLQTAIQAAALFSG